MLTAFRYLIALAIPALFASAAAAGEACHIATDDELAALSDAGDIRASYQLATRLLRPSADEHARDKARVQLKRGAAKKHPRSLYFLNMVGDGSKHPERLVIEAAERGFARAQADLVHRYADPKGKMYSMADSYAWIKVCAGRELFCEADSVKPILDRLSAKDKAAGEKIAERIQAGLQRYPKEEDVPLCLNDWEPRPALKQE